jgi:hypothetical protein
VGKALKTLFLCDYLLLESLRREISRGLLTSRRSHWDQGLTAAEMKRLPLSQIVQSLNFLLIPIRNSGVGLLAFKSGCSVFEQLTEKKALSLNCVKHNAEHF